MEQFPIIHTIKSFTKIYKARKNIATTLSIVVSNFLKTLVQIAVEYTGERGARDGYIQVGYTAHHKCIRKRVIRRPTDLTEI